MSSRPQAGTGLTPGDTVAGYRVDALLGEGAMGSVFRATRLADGATVALKVIKEGLTEDATHQRRFMHEARAAAAIEHPHLVGVLDAGESDGRRYLAMRYLEGTTLEQRIADTGALSVRETLRLATEIGGALAALHAAGLVHRDIKASNVLIDREGAAALADFGLAKGEGYSVLTVPGRIVGTIDYLAPERIRGEVGTPAGDVYAFGCLLFEALTRAPPFAGKSMMEVAFAHLEEQPRNPAEDYGDVPVAFGEAVLLALAKAPDDRPSVSEYVAALKSAAGHQ